MRNYKEIMDIAIVDDDEEFANAYAKTVGDYLRVRNFKFHIDIFSDGIEIEKLKKMYDLYMLDVEMPNVNGLLLAEKLRKHFGNKIELAFVTSRENAVFGVFRYEALGFVRKSYLQSDNIETLDHFVKKWIGKNKVIEFKTKSGIVYKTEDEIIYAVVYGHDMEIYCCDEIYKLRCAIDELKSMVRASSFIEPHRGYLVNCNYIKKLEHDRIILDNGESIPLSKRNRDKVKSKFFAFLNDR